MFLAPYAERSLSISLWTVSLGLSRPARDFGVDGYSTFIIPDWMQSFSEMQEIAAVLGQEPAARMPLYVFVDFHQIDSGLNEGPPYLVSFCGSDRLDNWTALEPAVRKARKEAWTRALIDDIDRHFPGIAGAVVHHEMSNAETLHDYLNTPGGAVYGFSPDIDAPGAFPPGPHGHRGAVALICIHHSWRIHRLDTGGARAATEAMQKCNRREQPTLSNRRIEV